MRKFLSIILCVYLVFGGVVGVYADNNTKIRIKDNKHQDAPIVEPTKTPESLVTDPNEITKTKDLIVEDPSETKTLTDSTISIVVNNTPLVLDVAPIIVNVRTLVPLRSISKALNVDITWVDGQQLIYFSNDNSTFYLKLGVPAVVIKKGDEITINTIDVAPIIKDGRTLVPLRFLVESLGIDVSYDEITNTVYISK